MTCIVSSCQRRVILVSTGSRSNVEPHVALAQSLQKRGLQVKIATEFCLKAYIENSGIEFVCLYNESMKQDNNRSKTKSSLFYTISRRGKRNPNAHQILDSYQSVLVDVDVIIASGDSIYPAYSIAQSSDIAFIPLFLQPVMPTSEFYSLFTQKLLDRLCFFNKKWTHEYILTSTWAAENKAMGYNDWRKKELSLKAIGKKGLLGELTKNANIPILIPCSTLTCGSRLCKPCDYDERIHLGGFLYLEDRNVAIDVDANLFDFLHRCDYTFDEVGNEETKSERLIESNTLCCIINV